jgi:probable F420-dependent oxidoreductase
MKLDALAMGLKLTETQRFAQDAARAGFSGLWFTESGRTAYLGCTAAALSGADLDIGTAIAVAFPRSPMITAKVAWELADATQGRFVLGLGTQVKAHITRRYSTEYEHPGPRLREYVLALRAIFKAFQGEAKLDFHGDFYDFDLLPDQWSGGRIEHPDVPIYIAAVRPWMLRMGGEVADGIHVHPFHSRRYLDEVIRPNVAEGAEGAGREAGDVKLVVPVLTIVGDSEEERKAARNAARMQIAFYGSTRTYRGVFELHGWEGTSEKLHALQRQGDLAGMSETITDEMLDVYAVTARWDELAGRLRERYAGVADRLLMYFAGWGWRDDPSRLERWSRVAREIHAA